MSHGALHGGMSFQAIGVDLSAPERERDVVTADVLDSWFDPSPRVLGRLRNNLPFLLRNSPPLYAEGMVQEIARARGLREWNIVAGAGSSSLIFSALPRLLPAGARVLMLDPMYGEYKHVCSVLLRAKTTVHQLTAENQFAVEGKALPKDTDAVLLVNPNNPTGRLWPKRELLAWLDSVPTRTLVWVDEAYIDYAGAGESVEAEAAKRPNLVVLKSMSKAYALSGLRVAYLTACRELLLRIMPALPPWPVALPAQMAAIEALRDVEYYSARWAQTHELRREATAALKGVTVHPSSANFYLVELEQPAAVAARLRSANVFVREFPDSAILESRFLRVAVKDREQNGRIVEAFREAL